MFERTLPPVIPAQAGIHLSASASGPMDPRLRGDDGVGGVVEVQLLPGISLEGSAG